MALTILLLLPMVLAEEVATPANLLQPRNFNYHPYANLIEPTKQGPVLFPNDGPPRPRTPLIVTSRPLLESIARSDLNNTIAEQSQVNRVSFKPGFLARVKDYRPFVYPVPTITPFSSYDEPPYSDVLKKARLHAIGKEDRYYNDYEEQTVLPPIYKALADHAKNKVLKLQQRKQPKYDHQSDYSPRHRSEDIGNEEEQNKNYAFSYTVKDQKTGDDFSHKQHSSGSATNGEYRVRLPDGRMQIVSYTADKNGYKADVRYDDEDTNSGNRIEYNNFNQNVKHSIDYAKGNTYKFDDGSNRNLVNENKYDYVNNRNYKVDNDKKYKTNDYYQYDTSKEYYNDDLSTEYENKNYDYEPHKSKFTVFANKNTDHLNFKPTRKYEATTVKPSYEQLKDLLVNNEVYSTVQPNYFTRNPVELNVPSTTPISNYEGTTEHVVVIGGNKPVLYTSIVNSVPITPSPVFTSNKYIVSSTPGNFLVSTIAGLRDKTAVTAKPILSQKFIDRINKYLSFKK
ncbi:uncharacterized protein LOC128681254 [Plodia interpunctella]|uniref:uncharacterized protein LOC128681254 n=1 Tax=Plodia interpunctella TaxID=58824 RepID=UPI0023685C01|nr:uncharacterized protein LOC128681254 [Plodia interpunctella]